MDNLPPTASRFEVENEIIFFHTLIKTLDVDDEDFHSTKAGYEQVLQSLELRLQSFQHSTHSSRPQTPQNQIDTDDQALSTTSFTLPSRDRPRAAGMDSTPLGHKAQQARLALTNSNVAEGPTFMGNGQTARPHKRTHDGSSNHYLGDDLRDSASASARKVRRTSNTPDASTASTPRTEDSLEVADTLLATRLGLSRSRDDIIRQHLARLKQEEDDANLARALAAPQPWSSTYSSAPSTQAVLSSNGTFQRRKPSDLPPLPPLPQPYFGNGATPSIKPETYRDSPEASRGRGLAEVPNVKHEPWIKHQPGVSNSAPMSQYGDESNRHRFDQDDDEEDFLEISRNDFLHNQPQAQRPYSAYYNGNMQGRGPNYGFPATLHQSTGAYRTASPTASSTPGTYPRQGYDGFPDSNFRRLQFLQSMTRAMPGQFPILDDGYDSDPDVSFVGIRNRDHSLDEELRMRNMGYMLADPTKTREEIEKLLENIRPDEDLPASMLEGNPDGLKVALMPHQKLGLAWLKSQEEGNNKGSILADEMGLGKTVQAISLILERPSGDYFKKTTLILAPVALMRQWEREIKEKVQSTHRLTVYILHGERKKRIRFEDLRKYDVVLSTFGTLAHEYKRKKNLEEELKADPSSSRREKFLLLGEECVFHRVILDEAQCIKNKATQTSLGALHLKATYRLCMTGTPCMNNIGELYPLIRFLRIAPYNEEGLFNRHFVRGLRDNGARSMQKLQILLKAILLRRNKTSLIDGKPILQLPPRHNNETKALFDDDQAAFYNALETQTRLEVSKYLQRDKIGAKQYANILVRLLRLRQACCHPHLIRDFAEDRPADMSDQEMLALARALAPEVIARIIAAGSEQECPVCYDITSNATIAFPCGHSLCAECWARIMDPALAIQNGEERVEAKCPECRSKLEPKHALTWKIFKRVHLRDEEDDQAELEDLDPDSETDSEESSEDDDDVDSQGDIRDFIVPDDYEDGNEHDGFGKSRPKSSAKTSSESNNDVKAEDDGDDDDKNDLAQLSSKAKGKRPKKVKISLAQLKKEGMRNMAAKKRYLRRLRRDWVSSAKIDKLTEILQNVRASDPREKTIIFSQFTSFLDLIEVRLDERGYRFQRYDGSMSANARADAVDAFRDDPTVTIMLCSLKAGNAGLNLNAASQVVILDPFWNPYIEEQAIDRAHRIGQTRPVHVHRICIENTVEDRILALQEKKRAVISQALDEKAGSTLARLGRRELAFLFGIEPNVPS